MPDVSNWFIYLIRTRNGVLYTGITTDVERRFQEHCAGARGAKALRGKGPLQLVYQQAVADRSSAARLEAAIKKLSKSHKERLVSGSLQLQELGIV